MVSISVTSYHSEKMSFLKNMEDICGQDYKYIYIMNHNVLWPNIFFICELSTTKAIQKIILQICVGCVWCIEILMKKHEQALR